MACASRGEVLTRSFEIRAEIGLDAICLWGEQKRRIKTAEVGDRIDSLGKTWLDLITALLSSKRSLPSYYFDG
ncbi:hypothetical protein BHE74_00025890 [Ensete ventricosum]|nr:hypothetical protein BHE74_00025890 [Ensete ventricosum]